MSTTAPTRPQRPSRRPPDGVIASQVEPRIVERRRSVERESRRRRRRVLIGGCVVIALILAAIGSTMSPLLDVDRITVVGHGHVSEADLIDASGVSHGDRLVDLDVNAARRALMEIPWVASARVVRDWPDAVRISVTEERPVASVRATYGSVLVSTTGRVLEQLVAIDPAYPHLEYGRPLVLVPDSHRGGTRAADDGSDRVGAVVSAQLQHALAVFERVSDDMRGELMAANMATDGTLTFQLADGTEVRFGPPEDVAAKLLAIQSVLTQVVRDCMKTLDVREPTRPSVSRGPGCPGISPVEPESADSTAKSTGSSGTGGSSGGTSGGTSTPAKAGTGTTTGSGTGTTTGSGTTTATVGPPRTTTTIGGGDR
ncbi:hypothetical protein BH10ACT3_BH10ACT3_13460 [soil metagenome]